MKRYAVSIWFSLAIACAPVHPPPPPAPAMIEFDAIVCATQPVADHCPAPLAGATLVLAGLPDESKMQRTNADGYSLWRVPASLRDTYFQITADGYKPLDSGTIHPVDLIGHHNFYVLTPALSNAGEHGALHRDGPVFRDESGAIWSWRGATDFSLLKRYLDGEDIQPILTDRIAVGANILRVLGMMDNIAHLYPQEHADYYDKLGTFADLLASRGMRFELTVFADAKNKVDASRSVMPDEGDQRAHLARVVAALAGHWNVVLELCNECEMNGVVPQDFQKPAGLLASPGSSGSDGLPETPLWDYDTHHGRRDANWPRDSKTSMDLRDGWGCFPDDPMCVAWPGTHAPVVQDEPIGAAEMNDPGRRSNVPDDFAYFAANAGLFGAGATFHSEDGIASRVYKPVQRTCAEAFFTALRWVPTSTQTAPYQRGCAEGGACVGDMPLQHSDTWADRTYCKDADGFEWCVATRPTADWQAQALRGCTVVEQPTRGFVKLRCP